MPRRIHVPDVRIGEIPLPEREAHHVRDVLRLQRGEAVEVFDDAGNVGSGRLRDLDSSGVTVLVDEVKSPAANAGQIVVAAAVPKGNRADWMVEKLSELGVDTFIPLATERGVVLPEGKNKLDRWGRLAEEAAKQSRRLGVMRIESLTPLPDAVSAAMSAGTAWCLSTTPGAARASDVASQFADGRVTLFIGPEGGWTSDELRLFEQSGVPGMKLTGTILRIETAAVAAASVVASLRRS